MSIIGIDFGTSLNKIGWFNELGFKIVSNSSRNPTTPSVAFILHENKWLYGKKAIKQGVSHKKQLFFETKIMLGRNIDDPIIQKMKDYWPFQIENENNKIKLNVFVDKKLISFYPYQVTGLILQNLIEVSNLKQHIQKSEIIISVPAFSNIEMINEIDKGAKYGDFHISCFITEPILALICYLYNTNIDFSQKQTIMMYSLGSSFLDVSIIQIDNDSFQISTQRDDNVYGKQFDENIFTHVLSEMREKYPKKCNLLKRPNMQSKLLEAVEEAKINLSEASIDKTDIIIEDEDDDEEEEDSNRFELTLTRDEFNSINAPLFEKSMVLVENIIDQQGQKIDHLFLVGGSTHIRRIQELLLAKTAKEATRGVDPREAVALGACIAGAHIFSDKVKFAMEERKLGLISGVFGKLEATVRFACEIGLSFGNEGGLTESVFGEFEEVPCSAERTVRVEKKCERVEFFSVRGGGEKEALFEEVLEKPVEGEVKISVRAVVEGGTSKVRFEAEIGDNKVSFVSEELKMNRIYWPQQKREETQQQEEEEVEKQNQEGKEQQKEKEVEKQNQEGKEQQKEKVEKQKQEGKEQQQEEEVEKQNQVETKQQESKAKMQILKVQPHKVEGKKQANTLQQVRTWQKPAGNRQGKPNTKQPKKDNNNDGDGPCLLI